MDRQALFVAACFYYWMRRTLMRSTQTERRCWVREMFQARPTEGVYALLFPRLLEEENNQMKRERRRLCQIDSKPITTNVYPIDQPAIHRSGHGVRSTCASVSRTIGHGDQGGQQRSDRSTKATNRTSRDGLRTRHGDEQGHDATPGGRGPQG